MSCVGILRRPSLVPGISRHLSLAVPETVGMSLGSHFDLRNFQTEISASSILKKLERPNGAMIMALSPL